MKRMMMTTSSWSCDGPEAQKFEEFKKVVFLVQIIRWVAGCQSNGASPFSFERTVMPTPCLSDVAKAGCAYPGSAVESYKLVDDCKQSNTRGGAERRKGIGSANQLERKSQMNATETALKELPHRYPRLVLDSFEDKRGYGGATTLWMDRNIFLDCPQMDPRERSLRPKISRESFLLNLNPYVAHALNTGAEEIPNFQSLVQRKRAVSTFPTKEAVAASEHVIFGRGSVTRVGRSSVENEEDRLWRAPWLPKAGQRSANFVDWSLVDVRTAKLYQTVLGVSFSPILNSMVGLVPDRIAAKESVTIGAGPELFYLVVFRQLIGMKTPEPRWLSRRVVTELFPHLIASYEIDKVRMQAILSVPMSIIIMLPRSLLGEGSGETGFSRGPLFSTLKFSESFEGEGDQVVVRAVPISSLLAAQKDRLADISHLWALVQFTGPTGPLTECIKFMFDSIHSYNLQTFRMKEGSKSGREIDQHQVLQRQAVCFFLIPRDMKYQIYSSTEEMLAVLIANGFFSVRREKDGFFDFSFPEFNEFGVRPVPSWTGDCVTKFGDYFVKDERAADVGYGFPLLLNSVPHRLGQMVCCLVVDIARRLGTVLYSELAVLEGRRLPPGKKERRLGRDRRIEDNESERKKNVFLGQLMKCLNSYRDDGFQLGTQFLLRGNLPLNGFSQDTESQIASKKDVIERQNCLWLPPGPPKLSSLTINRLEAGIWQLKKMTEAARTLREMFALGGGSISGGCEEWCWLESRGRGADEGNWGLEEAPVRGSVGKRLGVPYVELAKSLLLDQGNRHGWGCGVRRHLNEEGHCMFSSLEIEKRVGQVKGRFFLSESQLIDIGCSVLEACLVCFGGPGCFSEAIRAAPPPRCDLFGRVCFSKDGGSEGNSFWKCYDPSTNLDDESKTASSVLTTDEKSEDEEPEESSVGATSAVTGIGKKSKRQKICKQETAQPSATSVVLRQTLGPQPHGITSRPRSRASSTMADDEATSLNGLEDEGEDDIHDGPAIHVASGDFVFGDEVIVLQYDREGVIDTDVSSSGNGEGVIKRKKRSRRAAQVAALDSRKRRKRSNDVED